MNNPEIQVAYSGFVPLQLIDQGERGTMRVIENAALPFRIQRLYTMSGMQGKEGRGAHTHKKTVQVIYAIRGSFVLDLDDGVRKQSLVLSDAMPGVLLGPMLWHSMRDFTPDCVVLVVADAPYDEADYIRDYEEFKKYARTV